MDLHIILDIKNGLRKNEIFNDYLTKRKYFFCFGIHIELTHTNVKFECYEMDKIFGT